MSSTAALRDCPDVLGGTPWCASAKPWQHPQQQQQQQQQKNACAEFVEYVFDATGQGPCSTSDAFACRCGPAGQWPAFEFEQAETWDETVRSAFVCQKQ